VDAGELLVAGFGYIDGNLVIIGGCLQHTLLGAFGPQDPTLASWIDTDRP